MRRRAGAQRIEEWGLRLTEEVENHESAELRLDWTSASSDDGASRPGAANAPCGVDLDDRPPPEDAASSGRVLLFRPRPQEPVDDPLGRCLDDRGRVDVDLAAQLLGAELHEALRPVLLAVAAAARSSIEADEDLVRLLNRAVEIGIVGGVRYPVNTAEMALVAAIAHLGPDHDLTATASANLILARRSAGRTGDVHPILDRRGDVHRSMPRPTTGVATFSGRVLSPQHVAEVMTSGSASVAACLGEGGRVDLDVAAQLLGDSVPEHLRPLLVALVETVRSSAAAAEDLMALLNQALGQLLGGTCAEPPAGRTVEMVLAAAKSHLGPEHPDTITARDNLASSLLAGNRPADALAILVGVVADRERILGPDHPGSISARTRLAVCYRRAGRREEAVAIFAGVAADCTRVFGPDHPDTLTAQANLAAAYTSVGRGAKALTMLERVVADSARLLGRNHPDTITARAELASSYAAAGRRADALAMFESVVFDRSRVLGAEHPDTLTARFDLAAFYRSTGRTAQSLMAFERVLEDRQRLLGVDHPSTVATRATLASACRAAGKTARALTLFEEVVADRERLLGPDHPKTLTARANLSRSYLSAGRPAEAVALLGQVVADRSRLLGTDHPKTLTARANLAIAYRSTGRTAKAEAILRQVANDYERLLGPGHPDTVSARAQLAAVTAGEGGRPRS